MALSASALETPDLESLDLGSETGVTNVTGKSPTQLALARFRHDKLSMIALAVVLLYVVAGILAPIANSMGWIDPIGQHLKLLDFTVGGTPKGGGWGSVSWSHPFGVVPGTGQDLFARILLGTTYSLAIALSATILTLVLGAVLGIVSGFSGGWIDAVVGRLTDLTLSFPQTLMLLALSTVAVDFIQTRLHVGNATLANGSYVVIVLAIFGWPQIARVIRGQVLSLREQEFVQAAQLFGASKGRIYFKEILPNVWAPLLVYFTLTLPAYVSAEAALSFLGVGIKPPAPTLGNVLNDAVSYYQADFAYFLLPALMIAIIVISFNLVGDGLRDALDPKSMR